jgi:hypothetical protein
MLLRQDNGATTNLSFAAKHVGMSLVLAWGRSQPPGTQLRSSSFSYPRALPRTSGSSIHAQYVTKHKKNYPKLTSQALKN